VGRKNIPVYRVVLTDSQNSTKSGKYIEVLGSHDPRKHESDIKTDRVKYWMSKGAKLTGTMHNLLISKKIIEGKKVNVLPKKKPILKEKPAEVAKPATPTPEVAA